MDTEINKIAEQYAEYTVELLQEGLRDEITTEMQTFSVIQSQIIAIVNRLIVNLQQYKSKEYYNINSSLSASAQKLDFLKEKIYDDFFQLQNIINVYIGQKIIITYVHQDPVTGEREIRLIENTVKNLDKSTRYSKLEYQMNQHYALLTNTLPKEKNQNLQNTALEVERRFQRYNRQILWKANNQWNGYRLTNKGPINEAYVSFFINNFEMASNVLDNIHTFMTSIDPQGVIRADNANGFLIGDVSAGGVQLAVKGEWGSPQGFIQVINELTKMKEQNFSEASFKAFIEQFTTVAQEKASSLTKKLHGNTIKRLIKEFTEEELLKLTQI